MPRPPSLVKLLLGKTPAKPTPKTITPAPQRVETPAVERPAATIVKPHLVPTQFVFLPHKNQHSRELEIHEAMLTRDPGLGTLRDLLKDFFDGAEFEWVPVYTQEFPPNLKRPPWWPRPNQALDMFVDKTGALKHLPINPYASHHLFRGAIYGPAVLFLRKVWWS